MGFPGQGEVLGPLAQAVCGDDGLHRTMSQWDTPAVWGAAPTSSQASLAKDRQHQLITALAPLPFS